MNRKILAHRVVVPIPAFLILLALLAACSPTLPLPLTGGSTPTLVSTVAIPTVQAPTVAPTAAPVSPTIAPAPMMTMSMPATPPVSAPSGSVPATGVQQVTIASFAFTPAALTVSAGSTVTWTNHDSVAHTVTADNGAFDSGSLAPGASFSFTFKQPGTFAYHCQFHPNMVAKVTVSAGSAAAPAAVMPTATKPAAIQQPAPQNQAGVQLVSVANFAFSPATLTIPAGTKVRWTNNDTTTHTVTADSGTFDSGPLAPGATFAVTFSQAGTYTYHCKIHPNMVGKVIVTGPGASPANPGSGSSGGMNGGGSGSGSGGSQGGGSGGSSGGYHY